MLSRKFALLGIVAFLTNFGTSDGGTHQPENTENESKQAEVELLIVCDMEFSDRFDHNRQKMTDYWAVYMWDVNMRFKTLPSVDISFRITSLLIINNTVDQPFVEEARSESGTISLDDVWGNFGKWIYSQENNLTLTGFDVALLVTGAQLNDLQTNLASSSSPGTACLKNDTSQISLNTITLHASAAWGNTCGALETALGWILGAREDKDTDCWSDQYLMGNRKCNRKQYMFSTCSDAAITEFVLSKGASCLRISSAEGMDVLEETNVTHPPSLDDQCAMFTSNKNATAEKDEDRCVLSKCSLKEDGHAKFLQFLSPLDNSPCDEGKVCFRGRCLPQGFQLRNMGTGKCLQHSADRNALSDYPVLVDCLRSPTPLEEFRIQESGQLGTFLMTPIVILDTSSPQPEQDECLSVEMFDHNITGDNLQYSSCRTSQHYLGWNFIKINGSSEFLLYHNETKRCAGVSSYFDTSVKLHVTCNYNDRRMRWTLVKRPVVSLGWFKTSSHYLSKNIAINKTVTSVKSNGEYQEKMTKTTVRQFKDLLSRVMIIFFFVCLILAGCVYIAYYYKS